MSDKMECPGCSSYTSSVLSHFLDGEDCPYCGLSAGAMGEIMAVRKSKADKDLIAKYEAMVKEIGSARAETEKARRFWRAIKDAMDDFESEEN